MDEFSYWLGAMLQDQVADELGELYLGMATLDYVVPDPVLTSVEIVARRYRFDPRVVAALCERYRDLHVKKHGREWNS